MKHRGVEPVSQLNGIKSEIEDLLPLEVETAALAGDLLYVGSGSPVYSDLAFFVLVGGANQARGLWRFVFLDYRLVALLAATAIGPCILHALHPFAIAPVLGNEPLHRTEAWAGIGGKLGSEIVGSGREAKTSMFCTPRAVS